MTDERRRSVDVAIVGGGLAGAAMAIRLARAGRSVTVLERSRWWRWSACGVFASPAAVAELRLLGLDDRALDDVARPIPAMRVETARQSVFRLTYGALAEGTRGAVGFDREGLDEGLLARASAAGAEVMRGRAVLGFERPAGGSQGSISVRGPDGVSTVAARFVIGADGTGSVVARDAGVARSTWLGRRVGLTWHIADPHRSRRHDARMVVLDGAYCGLAPVPGGRLNVGIVLAGRRRLRALGSDGARAVGAAILDEVLDRDGTTRPRTTPAPLDAIVGAAPLGQRVTRRAGTGWALIGDAAGFLDPFTGEGIHRALVSARYAADAIVDAGGRTDDLSAYDRAMGARFRTKDVVSLIVQAFLARPSLFDYAARRLADRERARETMGLVMGDLVPATRALDPRFLATLLAP